MLADHSRAVVHTVTKGDVCASPYVVADVLSLLKRQHHGVQLLQVHASPFRMELTVEGLHLVVWIGEKNEQLEGERIFYVSCGTGGAVRFNALKHLYNVPAGVVKTKKMAKVLTELRQDDQWMEQWSTPRFASTLAKFKTPTARPLEFLCEREFVKAIHVCMSSVHW